MVDYFNNFLKLQKSNLYLRKHRKKINGLTKYSIFSAGDVIKVVYLNLFLFF
jgi:hypothetical protein